MEQPGVRRWVWIISLALVLAGCSGSGLPNPSPVAPTASPAPISVVRTLTSSPVANACQLAPLVVPTAPATIPGYTEYDPTTGLHMTGSVQRIDPQSYRLQVIGKVDHPLELTYDDLRCMPKISTEAAVVCPGFFVDHATWSGAPLANVLRLAAIQPGAKRILLTSADGYTTAVDLDAALADGNIIAYEWQGQPLPIFHGFPVRAAFPGLQGGFWVKYLVAIDVE